MYAAAGRMALHQADLPRARAALTQAQRLRPALTYAVPHFAVQARIELTQVHLVLADLAGARTLMREVHEILLRRPHLYLTAHMAFRLDARVVFPATVVATLLVADAWFDVTTSATAQAAIGALILALAVELPAAGFSLYVAYRVGRRVRELAHLEHLTGPDPPVPDQAQAHPALPSDSTSPVGLPPER